MKVRIDRVALLTGALVAFGLAMPVLIAFAVVDLAGNGVDCNSNLNTLFSAGLLVAIGIGGAAAARRRLSEPLTHGALAGLAASLAIVVLRIITNVAAGYGFTSRRCGVSLYVAGFTGITFSTFAGMVGGWIALRRSQST